jgi:hypothetical protein
MREANTMLAAFGLAKSSFNRACIANGFICLEGLVADAETWHSRCMERDYMYMIRFCYIRGSLSRSSIAWNRILNKMSIRYIKIVFLSSENFIIILMNE